MSDNVAAKNGGNKAKPLVDFPAIKALMKLALENKVQIVKAGGVEIVFHPSAFVKLPDAFNVVPIEKQKPSQEKTGEDEDLLYHSA